MTFLISADIVEGVKEANQSKSKIRNFFMNLRILSVKNLRIYVIMIAIYQVVSLYLQFGCSYHFFCVLASQI